MTRDEILALAECPTDDLPESRREWQIEDRDTLEWAMGILAEGEREAAQIRRAAEAARAQVAAREADLLRRVTRSTAFLAAAVEGYARTHRSDLIGGRSKTAHLIHGEIAYRASGEKVEVRDSDAALAWCQSQPVETDLVRNKPEINKRALSAHVLGTGEIPPGCEILPATETITIKPAAPDAIEAAPSRKELP